MIAETSSNFDQSVNSNAFSIEMNASMFTMLTKNVYNNVILAPIREWSTNAVDACIAANKPIKFDVHMPTMSNPTFSVRDYGTGLPVEDIEGLFSVLGASTKRDSNAYNGTFGIGRMSGLAYASSFTVESFHNGNHHSYLISIKDGIPSSVDLGTQPTKEEDGLRLSLTVESRDVATFNKEATFLYRYFKDKPNINIDIPAKPETSIEGDGWYLQKDTNWGESFVVMGNVPYKINTRNLDMPDGIVFEAPIGAVSITPGRESLTYDDKTTDYINEFAKKIKKDIQQQYLDEYNNAANNLQKMSVTKRYLNGFSSFIAPKAPSGSMLRYSSLYFTPTFTNADTAEYIGNGKSRKNEHWSGYDPIEYNFLILDVITQSGVHLQNYMNSLDSSVRYRTIIVKPASRSKIGVERMMDTVELEMAVIGITDITRLSDNLTDLEGEAEEKAKLEARQFQAKEYYGSGTGIFGILDSSQTTTEYLYMHPDDTEELGRACYQARYLLSSDLDQDIPRLIIIPKKAIKAVEANDKFIHAYDYLQKKLDKVIIRQQTSKFQDITNSRFISHKDYPPKLRHIADAIMSYNKKATYYSASLSTIRTHFTLNEKHPPYKISDVTDLYPQICKYDTWGTSGVELAIHYTQLEDTIRAYKDTITRLGGNPDE